jgi:hypothetical protein
VQQPTTPPPPSPEEVRAIARLLGASPDRLVSWKVPGPGRLGESVLALRVPQLNGYEPPNTTWVEWDRGGAKSQRIAALYASDEGGVIVVSHETGPELWVTVAEGVVGGAAGAAVTALLDHLRQRRRGMVDTNLWSYRIRREWDANGTLRSEEVELEQRDTG